MTCTNFLPPATRAERVRRVASIFSTYLCGEAIIALHDVARRLEDGLENKAPFGIDESPYYYMDYQHHNL